MNITQFTMEEVRCFAERQEFNIRPLTFWSEKTVLARPQRWHVFRC